MQGYILEPYERVIGECDKIKTLAVALQDCSRLAKQTQIFGVDGYCLGSYEGCGYLNRFMPFYTHQVPLLTYRQHYLIPLIFRYCSDSQRLFLEAERLPSFFLLLDWYLTYKPQDVVMNYHTTRDFYQKPKRVEKQMIDSAFLVFRLSEIVDAAGLPLSQIKTFEEFLSWNRRHRLIDNGSVGRHSMIFDPDNEANRSELAMIITILRLKYPLMVDFLQQKVAG